MEGATGSRWQRHRKDRRAKGLCMVHGCPVRSGDESRCEEHRLKHNAEQVAYMRKRRANAGRNARP